MFRSKVQPSSSLLTLDADLLFLILSLLPTLKDAVSAVSVNKILRVFFFDRHFWQLQLKRDLYVKAPPTTKSAGLFYQQRISQMASEAKLAITFLGAYRFVTGIGGVNKQEKLKRVTSLKKVLATGTRKSFFELAGKSIYGHQTSVLSYVEESSLWKQAMNKNQGTVLFTADKLLALYLLPDKTSREFCHSISFFLMTLAVTNSHIALYQLIHQLPPDKKKLLLERTGADMLCQAIAMGQLETVKLLLGEGVDPNHYGLYLDSGEDHNLRRLLALPLYFLHVLQKQKDNVIKKNTIITEMVALLLKFGANVDLPATQEVGASVEENEARQSLREVTRLFLVETEANKTQYKKLEFTVLQNSVKTIFQAPELKYNDENMRPGLGR